MLITAIFNFQFSYEAVANVIESEEGSGKSYVVNRTVFIVSEKPADYWLTQLRAATGKKAIIVTAWKAITIPHPDEAVTQWLEIMALQTANRSAVTAETQAYQ